MFGWPGPDWVSGNGFDILVLALSLPVPPTVTRPPDITPKDTFNEWKFVDVIPLSNIEMQIPQNGGGLRSIRLLRH